MFLITRHFSPGALYCGGADNFTYRFRGIGTLECRTNPHTEKFCRHPGVEFSSYPQPILKKLNDRNKELSFFCENGYYGGGKLTCNENSGEYELSEGSKCIPLSCASSSVENSNYSSSGSILGKTGDQVNVVCDEGYWGGGLGHACLIVSLKVKGASL